MSNGDDQPHGGYDRFPRSSAGVGGGSLFDEQQHPVPATPPPVSSVFDDPTIPVSRSSHLVDGPTRSRILEPDTYRGAPDPFPYGPTATYDRPVVRPHVFAERQAPPFAPAGPQREAAVPPLERFMEGAYRWRSLLGLGLAAVMTVAIVVAYRGASRRDTADLAVTPADGQTAAAFGDTTAPSTVALAGSLTSEQQVGSSVGEVASTTQFPSGPTQTSARATVRSTTSTTRQPSASSTSASTSTPASGSTPTSSASSSGPSSSSPTSGSTTPASGSTTPTSTASSSPTSGSTGSSTATSLNTRAKLEAEDGALLGEAQIAADHVGYTGTGFVSSIVIQGRGVTVTAKNMAAGLTTLRVRYAAGNTALTSPRRLTLRVNGVDVRNALTMPNTTAWTDWKTVSVDIDLKEGDNTITLVLANGDNGVVNIDSFDIG